MSGARAAGGAPPDRGAGAQRSAGRNDTARTELGRDGGGASARNPGRTAAQWFCLLGGLALLLGGLLGFLADASFDTAGSVAGNADTDRGGNANGELQGDGFLGFEVNGWHNLVHIASGLLLLAGAAKRRLAKTIAIVFGLTYGLVTLIGLIDGNDVLGIIPVNPADNILHIALTALGLGTGLASPGDDRDRLAMRTGGVEHVGESRGAAR